MPEHIRALIIIIFLALIGFSFAKKVAQKNISDIDFNKWRGVWFLVLIAAFMAHSFWIYIFLSSVFISIITKSAKNKMALFFILLFVIPPISGRIHAFGLVNYLVDLTHTRFIALIILLPAALAIAHENNFKFTRIWTDKFLLLYILLMLALELRDRTFTDALRQLLYVFPDIFLPYYVASRSIKDLSQMNTVLYAFISSAFVIALIAVFEYLKRWLLYNPLGDVLGAVFNYGGYIGRDGSLRATASLAHPIVLGYFFAIALSFYLYLSTRISNVPIKRLGGLLILLGLIVSLSRGPWVGAVASIMIFILLNSSPIKNLSKLFLVCLITIPIILASPIGEKVYNLIPFIGKTDDFNVDYRERLFTNSMIVIDQNPLFGSTNWRDTPEMLAMIQGEGIIDVVNSYVGVALTMGYVGLSLFVAIFACVIFAILKRMRQIKDKKNSLHILGSSLVSALLATMVTIATTSSINTLPIIYWSVLGLGVSYTRIVSDYLKSKTSNNML